MQPHRVRSSRRPPSIQDEEIDHEIILIDHSASTVPVRPLSEVSGITTQPLEASESQIPLTGAASPSYGPGDDETGENEQMADEGRGEAEANGSTEAGPSSTANGRSTRLNGHSARSATRGKQQLQEHLRIIRTPDTAIDVLYENERGCFLCGLPLFSGAALGSLDDPPWTNEFHKPSPTDTRTAQVPDPSWEWSWPEWHINRDECIQTDKNGWEYSFLFSSKFSWHKPKWWNSFVRRRAWIRRRNIKVQDDNPDDASVKPDPQLLNPGYFNVGAERSSRASSVLERRSGDNRSSANPSRAPSRVPSRVSLDVSQAEGLPAPEELETIEMLMQALRECRIDRERLEMINGYLDNCTDDYRGLDEQMHEIMAMFIFQASRRQLLTRLIAVHDETEKEAKKKKHGKQQHKEAEQAPRSQDRLENITAAAHHADEEVRRLEYWSDVKGITESGKPDDVASGEKGWEGLDKSGAKGPEGSQGK